MSTRNTAKKKIDHCASVAKDLGEIIRFSCNEKFRVKCMNICQASTTYECQEILRKKLIELTEGNEKIKSRKRKATSKRDDSQGTIQEAFERQKRMESAGIIHKSIYVPDENSISLLESSPHVQRVLKQQPITDLFKKRRHIQKFNSIGLKPMIAVEEDFGRSLGSELKSFNGQSTTVSRESPRIISKPTNKLSTISEKSLLDPNNFIWDDNRTVAVPIRPNPVIHKSKLATSAILDNDAQSIMSDPRIFMWD